MQTPRSEEQWTEIADGFQSRWQLPHCVGALDGKHVAIIKPSHSGAQYINYKGFFSIVLLAMVDADYKFRYVDVGAPGRYSDGGVFAHCSLSKCLEDGSLNVPSPEPLPMYENIAIPYYVVCDDAFPLRSYMMKPYIRRSLTDDEQVCNYRLSRGRRIVENAFGILAAVFRVLHTPIQLEPRKAEIIILCICTLHNYLRHRCGGAYISSVLNSDELTTDSTKLMPLATTSHKNSPSSAKYVRDLLMQYFVTVGSVSWQFDYRSSF